MWYKPDTRFSTPKAYVKIDFNCPYAGKSPEAEVLTDMFTRLLMDYLNEYGEPLKFIEIESIKLGLLCLLFPELPNIDMMGSAEKHVFPSFSIFHLL